MILAHPSSHGTLPSLVPPGHLQAYRRLKLPVGSTIILGGFGLPRKGRGFHRRQGARVSHWLPRQPSSWSAEVWLLPAPSPGLSHAGQPGMAVWLRAGRAGPGSIDSLCGCGQVTHLLWVSVSPSVKWDGSSLWGYREDETSPHG